MNGWKPENVGKKRSLQKYKYSLNKPSAVVQLCDDNDGVKKTG